MRYRRVSYHYAVTLSTEASWVSEYDRPERQPSILRSTVCWRPNADVYETAESIIVTVDLAWVDPDAIEVTLFDDALVIEGQRRLDPADRAGYFHAANIRQGPFRLEVSLPSSIVPDRIDHRYDRGLLQLTIPKSATE
jgi:HSP20 family protein